MKAKMPRLTDRVTLRPDPKIGPLIVASLQERDLEGAIALCRLSVSGAQCTVIDVGSDDVVVRVRGTRRRFCVPADVVKSA